MQAPGFWLTFLYYFTITDLVVLAFASRHFGVGFFDYSIYPIGICAGLIAGILGSSLNRNVTVTTKVKRRATWQKEFDRILQEMGFTPQQEIEDFTVYRKSGWATLFSGRVFLKFEGKTATIIARSILVKELRESELKLDEKS